MSSETKTTPATAPGQPAAENRHGLSGELLFEIFCAVIFLGMIGLVFYNAFLRYVFGGSYPPSEEWARFLFIYITFFGAIEAFYWKKHIAVDMVCGHVLGHVPQMHRDPGHSADHGRPGAAA